jgi:hypothetical protein
MTKPRAAVVAVTMLLLLLGLVSTLPAGMPSPLPTSWTNASTPRWAVPYESNGSADASFRWQAISFFVAILLGSTLLVRWSWNGLRRDLTWLPSLTFGRAVSLVFLWGLLFVLILTMISGARELMTPGAWRKQGWTYKLEDAEAGVTPPAVDREARRGGLEQLRTALWQYAATHNGKFPVRDDPAIPSALWDVPEAPGFVFLYVPDRRAEDRGLLLVYEPEIDGPERQVLLTNGMLGTMDTSAIESALRDKETR